LFLGEPLGRSTDYQLLDGAALSVRFLFLGEPLGRSTDYQLLDGAALSVRFLFLGEPLGRSTDYQLLDGAAFVLSLFWDLIAVNLKWISPAPSVQFFAMPQAELCLFLLHLSMMVLINRASRYDSACGAQSSVKLE
jgi:hypothetical protein